MPTSITTCLQHHQGCEAAQRKGFSFGEPAIGLWVPQFRLFRATSERSPSERNPFRSPTTRLRFSRVSGDLGPEDWKGLHVLVALAGLGFPLCLFPG